MEATRSRNEFESDMQDVASRHLSELYKLWTEMGYESEELIHRMSTAKTYIDDTYDRMVEEERGHMDTILNQIQKLGKERQNLMKELGKKYSQDEDKYNNSQLTYLQIVRDLKQDVEGYQIEKDKRMVEVNDLHNDDEIVSDAVGEPVYKLIPKTIPTDKEMQELKDHIKRMKNMKIHRLAKFESAKNQILQLYTELDCEPNNTIERTMICGAIDEVILSTTNLNAIEKMLASLQGELDANRDIMDKMVEKTKLLCKRLDIDDSQYLEMVGYSRRHLKEFESRLDELEEMKMAHLSKFVEKSRQELRSLWDKCYCGQEQRNAFSLISSTDYNEEMLDEHENEVQRLKSYLEANSGIFDKINEWQCWFDKKKAIHDRSKDPNRLFARRKNNLLQEQNEEKEAKRMFPRMERELKEMVQHYDDHHDAKFSLMGIPFDDYISEIKSELEIDAKIDQQERKEHKRKLLEHETMYGAGKNLTPIINQTRTPNKSRRMDSKSRLHTPGSMRKFASVDRLGVSSSSKRAGAQLNPQSKRMRMNENSIIAGNLQSTIQSVDSTVSYKDLDVISSTFIKESKLYQPGSAARKTPLGSRQLKSSTPVRSNLRTPIADNTFKTPQSRARLVDSKSRNLRSGSKIPFLF